LRADEIKFDVFGVENRSMTRIEIWKVGEFASVLHRFAGGLQDFDEPEWARVFFHFEEECRKIIPHSSSERIQLRTLLANIQSCLSDSGSLKDVTVRAGLASGNREASQELISARADLVRLLEKLDRSTVEFIH
jgi:hypothetical protein